MTKYLKLVVALFVVSSLFACAPKGAKMSGDGWPVMGFNNQRTSNSSFAGPVKNAIKWTRDTDSVLTAMVVGRNGILYTGSYDHNIYALTKDGEELWRYKTKGVVYSAPAISADGKTLYVGSADKRMYAINSVTGELKWDFKTDDVVNSSPVIGADGTIYFGSYDFRVYALNPDGTMKWKYLADGKVFSSPALGHDGTVYVGSNDGNLYSLDGQTGKLNWFFTTDDIIVSSPAVTKNGDIIIGSYDGTLYMVSKRGEKQWGASLGAAIESSPAVSDEKGVIFVGCDDNKLYSIWLSNGKIKGSFDAGDKVVSSPIISKKGHVYFG